MLSYGFMQNAIFVSVFISILCPCIGIFLVLRRYSMIGDTLSHASLAGIAIGLLCGQSPVIGAFVFTSVCGALIEFLRRYFRKYTDLILTIVLSLCVGTAITIISSGKLHANADSFLFGSILTVNRFDIITVFVLSILSVLTLILLYHQLVYIAYDEDAAKIAGVRVGADQLRFLDTRGLGDRRIDPHRGRARAELHDRVARRHGATNEQGLQTNPDLRNRLQHIRHYAGVVRLLLSERCAGRIYRACFRGHSCAGDWSEKACKKGVGRYCELASLNH